MNRYSDQNAFHTEFEVISIYLDYDCNRISFVFKTENCVFFRNIVSQIFSQYFLHCCYKIMKKEKRKLLKMDVYF